MCTISKVNTNAYLSHLDSYILCGYPQLRVQQHIISKITFILTNYGYGFASDSYIHNHLFSSIEQEYLIKCNILFI